MANLSQDFIIKTRDWLKTWKAIDFGKPKNVIINNRPVFKGKSELTTIYKSFLTTTINNWRITEQAKNDNNQSGLTIAIIHIACKWQPTRKPNKFKFKVILRRKKKIDGNPTDTKTPPTPAQQPPPQLSSGDS